MDTRGAAYRECPDRAQMRFRGPSRKKEGERARRRYRFHRPLPKKEKEKEEKEDGIAKEREKAGRFCSTAPNEARVALLFGGETLDVRMKTLLSRLAAILRVECFQPAKEVFDPAGETTPETGVRRQCRIRWPCNF